MPVRPKPVRPGPRLVRQAAFAAAVLLVGGCGGGGGGSAPPPTATIDLTAANRDAVAHAAAGGMLAFGAMGALPLAGAAASASGRMAPLMLRPHGGRAQPLASGAPVVENCGVSGHVSVQLDDADGSASVSVGDTLTIVFEQCVDFVGETLDGSVAALYTQIGTSSLSARLTMAALRDSAPQHVLTLDGALRLDFAQTGSTTQTMRLTADGAFDVAIAAHSFSDTLTLQSGFVQEGRFDALAVPPGGGSAGSVVSTLRGSARVASAGGLVAIASDDAHPITSFDADVYPRSGALQVRGVHGTLALTAQSADTVRMDLDSDDDGVAETSDLVAWDWLL